jgi:hypothetical protein
MFRAALSKVHAALAEDDLRISSARFIRYRRPVIVAARPR